MGIYLDTANLEEIQKYMDMGIISGVTTNPKIVSNEGKLNFKKRIKDICDIVDDLSVSVELTKTKESEKVLIQEAKELSEISFENIAVKVPMWGNGKGLRITKELTKEGVEIPVNMTCCMSTEQAILAAEAGATFVSLFYRRIIDWNTPSEPVSEHDRLKAGQVPIERTRRYIEDQGLDTLIICGSIRKPTDVIECFSAGADIVTVPPKILAQMIKHERTESTIKEFDDSWEEFLKQNKK